MTIGERIKCRREELGISVDEIAKRLGKHRATVYRYESNDIGTLPTDVLEPLAIVLETTPAYLMGWEPEAKEKPPVNDESLSDSRYNIITIRGRDGSVEYKRLTDEQLSTLESIIDLMPDPPEDL